MYRAKFRLLSMSNRSVAGLLRLANDLKGSIELNEPIVMSFETEVQMIELKKAMKKEHFRHLVGWEYPREMN